MVTANSLLSVKVFILVSLFLNSMENKEIQHEVLPNDKFAITQEWLYWYNDFGKKKYAPYKNCGFVYRWTHTHNTAKFTFPCTDQHPHQSCMHKPKKKRKRRKAQDRESIWGLVSVSKHHHTASHLSWDSTTLHQTKQLATDLSLSVINITDFLFPSFYYVLW